MMIRAFSKVLKPTLCVFIHEYSQSSSCANLCMNSTYIADGKQITYVLFSHLKGAGTLIL